VRKPDGVTKDDVFAIEIHELDRKNPLNDDLLIPDSLKLPPPFDFERLTRFMAYGFLMAPVQHKWFSYLSATFPLTKTSATAAAMKRVAFDQLLFAPVGMHSPCRQEKRMLTLSRSGHFLHLHDHCRGWGP